MGYRELPHLQKCSADRERNLEHPVHHISVCFKYLSIVCLASLNHMVYRSITCFIVSGSEHSRARNPRRHGYAPPQLTLNWQNCTGGRQTAFKRGGGGVSFSLWSIASLYKRPAAGGSVGWSVCHNFLEEREVTIS